MYSVVCTYTLGKSIPLLLSQQKKSEGEGDEILEELQKKQSELKAVVSLGPLELQSILLARLMA